MTETISLTAAQVAAAFAVLGERPTHGPLSNLAPVRDPKALLADTGLLTQKGSLRKGTEAMFRTLAEPGKVVTATAVSGVVDGAATSRFFGPVEGGPFVAVARTPDGFDLATVESPSAVAGLVAGMLGIGDDPRPLPGDAIELSAAGWAVLGALADAGEPAPMPGVVRRALGRRAGPVVSAIRATTPTGATDPGQGGLGEAVNALGGEALVVRQHDGRLGLTKRGRAVARAMREFLVAGSLTVDHMSPDGPTRVVSVSSMRTPRRLFFGMWRVVDGSATIAVGEPGAAGAAGMVRAFIEASSVFGGSPPSPLPVVAATVGEDPGSDSREDESAPRRNPQWVAALLYGGLVVALAGAALGLTGGDDGELVAGSSDSTTSTAGTVTTAGSTTLGTTTTAASSTTEPVASSTSSSTTSTTASTTTSSTTTTTTIPTLLEDTFDGSTTATPLFGEGVVTATVTDGGTLRIESKVPGIIPITYPDPLPPTFDLSYAFFPSPVTGGSSFGAMVFGEDPSDGAMVDYLLVLTGQDGTLSFVPFDDAEFGAAETTPIPAEAGFGMNQRNTLRIVADGSGVHASVNGVFVASFDGPLPRPSGWWGPVIIGTDTEGEALLIDDVLVLPLP